MGDVVENKLALVGSLLQKRVTTLHVAFSSSSLE